MALPCSTARGETSAMLICHQRRTRRCAGRLLLRETIDPFEALALDLCCGRVLDIGAGAGLHSLELQRCSVAFGVRIVASPFGGHSPVTANEWQQRVRDGSAQRQHRRCAVIPAARLFVGRRRTSRDPAVGGSGANPRDWRCGAWDRAGANASSLAAPRPVGQQAHGSLRRY
jgi:hypothetical protein